MTLLKFPNGFLWGASTSAHQVEGGNHNDWSEWEKKHSVRLARESRNHFGHLPSWEFSRREAEEPWNYISGTACDHYHRYEEDFDLASSLGHNAHRFGIEWSRIEPEEGTFDTEAIEHYRTVILALRKRGMEPFVTLWHWTLPVWLAEKGGVAHTEFPQYFDRYVEAIVKALGREVKFWITMNEPELMASYSYMTGTWTPQKKNIFTYYRVLKNLINAHKLAYHTIKKYDTDCEIGIAKHEVVFEVLRPTFLNRTLQKIAHFMTNRWFLNQIKDHQDFIGLNFYNRNVIDNGFKKNKNKRVTDFGWEFHPESIFQALMDLKRYNKPIFITENGIADAKDSMREEWIRKSLVALHRAMTHGADVRGYLHWSLLDNFEWDKGYWLRFGLIAIDRQTMKRTPRPSAYTYAEVCRTNQLEVE
ncbi:MAG: glycoside hydrolase family 1 protein [Candidatus Moraniibacteriota bacterium]